MARIDVLPSIDIIRGFKKTLDFYLWRGLPCVRAWPRWRPARQTDASKASALLFGAVIRAFTLTHSTVLEQLEIEATGIPRTPRDIYASGVFGNLHEYKEAPPPVGKTLILDGWLASLAPITPITVVPQGIPGCSVLLTLQAGDVVILTATFDTANVGSILLGHTRRDAVVLSEAHTQASRQTTTTISRDSPGAGPFLYALFVSQTAGANGTCYQIHTKLLYQVWR